MPLPVTCTGCAAVYTVPDNLVGKSIRCKKCGETIPIAAAAPAAKPVVAKAAPVAAKPVKKPAVVVIDDDDDDDLPPPPKAKKPAAKPVKAAADDDDDDAPKKKSKAPLFVGIAAGVLLLAGGGAAVALFGFGGTKKDEVAGVPMGNGPMGVPSGMRVPPADGDADAAKSATKPPPAPAVKDASNPGSAGGKTAAADPPTPKPPAAAPVATPATAGRNIMDGRLDKFVLNKVKNASVFIKVEVPGGTATGSGWFGAEPGMVWTNAHVLNMKSPGSKEPKKMTMYLNSGTGEQREIAHNRLKILAVDRDIDLALVQVIGEANLPVPLPVKPSADLVETQGLNTIGYPFGYTPGMAGGKTKKEPEVSVRPTTFTAFRRDEYGQPRRIQIEGGVYTGNSGGPVVDGDGAVVGVVVEVIIDRLSGGQSQLGLAVPTEYVMGMLSGRIGEIEYGIPYRSEGKIKVPVKASVFDPLGRLSKVGVATWIGDTGDKYRKPGPEKPAAGVSDTDPGVVDLKYDEKAKTATGELVYPEPPAGRTFWAQPYYTNISVDRFHLPGIRVPMSGPPVDKTPVNLVAKFRPGVRRAVTLSNSGDLNEFEEGEGESKKDRVSIKSVLGLTELVVAKDSSDQGQAARLNMQFDTIQLKAEGLGGTLDEDAAPKQLIAMLNNNIKAAGAVGFLNFQGEMYRYIPNVLNVPDPTAKLFLSQLTNEAMEALAATSIPLPNKSVNAGETWQTVKATRLTLVGQKAGRGGKMERVLKEFKYTNTVVYTYVGQRERGGKKEAVVKVAGKIAPAAGSGAAASGELKGTAMIEIDTGTVVEAELDNEFELDTSGDGVKKRVSGINTYKLSRGAGNQ